MSGDVLPPNSIGVMQFQKQHTTKQDSMMQTHTTDFNNTWVRYLPFLTHTFPLAISDLSQRSNRARHGSMHKRHIKYSMCLKDISTLPDTTHHHFAFNRRLKLLVTADLMYSFREKKQVSFAVFSCFVQDRHSSRRQKQDFMWWVAALQALTRWKRKNKKRGEFHIS